MKNLDFQPHHACARWSNRILIFSLVGIAYLTLFPFQFNFEAWHGLRTFPFLLGTFAHHARNFDFLLNVLLFVPLGFGLSAQVRKRRGSWWASLLLSLAAGAITSYVVEVLQFYIPTRESGWEDVFSNTTGSVAGSSFLDSSATPFWDDPRKLKTHLKAGCLRLGPPRYFSCILRFGQGSRFHFSDKPV